MRWWGHLPRTPLGPRHSMALPPPTPRSAHTLGYERGLPLPTRGTRLPNGFRLWSRAATEPTFILCSPDISGGHGVHPGAGIQEDPGAPPIHLSPAKILRAQPVGEGVLVPITEGSFGGSSSYWGFLVGGLQSPCLPFPFFGWGVRAPLPPAPPFWFKASRSSISCNSGSKGSLVHSLQR